MKDREELVVGALLHDIGKVVRRAGDDRRHQIAGYDFTNKVKKFAVIQDYIHYHHEKDLLKKVWKTKRFGTCASQTTSRAKKE